MEKEITKKIRVYGIVQGVGFRPTVSRHADSCKIRQKERSLFLRILQSVRNARKNCMIPRIADTYIRLLIVRVVVRGLRFWMLFHMTESVRV